MLKVGSRRHRGDAGASVPAKQRRNARDGASELPRIVLADAPHSHLPLRLVLQGRRKPASALMRR